jgi:hypothetical protein
MAEPRLLDFAAIRGEQTRHAGDPPAAAFAPRPNARNNGTTDPVR